MLQNKSVLRVIQQEKPCRLAWFVNRNLNDTLETKIRKKSLKISNQNLKLIINTQFLIMKVTGNERNKSGSFSQDTLYKYFIFFI